MSGLRDTDHEDDLETLLTLELPHGGRLLVGVDDEGYLMAVLDGQGSLVDSGEAPTWTAVLDLVIAVAEPLEAEFPVSTDDSSDPIGGLDTGTGTELLSKVGPGSWVARLYDDESGETLEDGGSQHSWEFESIREYLLDLADYGLSEAEGSARRIASPEQLLGPGEQAWLIIGDEASWPSHDDLDAQRQQSSAGCLGEVWTAAKQTEPGDVLVVYFMAPRKAACFVARAQTEAFYSADIGVNSVRSPSDHQWWVHHTPLVPIEPISLSELRTAVGGHLVLRGRSGKFLRPETIDALTFRAIDPTDQPVLDQMTQRPTGRADLPEPTKMSVDEIARVAPGALRLESDVSTYVVEPTLRHVLGGTQLSVEAEFAIGRKRADFVVLDGSNPTCVIEVKLRARTPDEPSSPDVSQVVGYAEALGCSAILVDVSEFHLIGRDQDFVSFSGDRLHLAEILDRLREHILGG